MIPLSPYEPTTHRRIVPRYFAARPALIAILRDFVEELFASAAAAHGKQTWCEKTPLNVPSAPFLWELFPEATVVHIMRHPVSVVASHLHQPWAPAELWQVVAWLSPIYERWFRIRDALDLQQTRLVEVRLEDLHLHLREGHRNARLRQEHMVCCGRAHVTRCQRGHPSA